MKKFQHLKLWLLGAVLMPFLFQACQDSRDNAPIDTAHEYNSQVFVRWNELFMELDRYASGYRPGPAPRALGYLGFSAYESIVSAIPENNSLQHLFAGLEIPEVDESQEYYWPACINESYAFLMTRFFFHMETNYPVEFAKIEQLRRQLHDEYATQTSAEILERSEAHGRAVASAVYEWEKLDLVGHNAFLNPQPTDYTPPQGPGLWQPTFPDFNRAVYPYWGNVRLFAMDETERLARPPIPYSELPSSLFYTQALEVYNTVNLIKNNEPGAYEQRWVAEFWSDDILGLTFSPPARLIAIADQVVIHEDLDLAKAAELYAKVGMALSDAGVATWHSKYVYNVERPVSYIRRIVAQQYPEAANWSSILNNPVAGFNGVTPAFPAYPSGHSAFGGAGGKILSAMFEFNAENPGTYTMTDRCHLNRSEFNGTPRTFYSFKELADEDAYSRIPLGVHFRMDCSEGLRLGELAAQRVLELPWKR